MRTFLPDEDKEEELDGGKDWNEDKESDVGENSNEDGEEVSVSSNLPRVSARRPTQEEVEEGCSPCCLAIRHCPGKENCDAHSDSGVTTLWSVLEEIFGSGFHMVGSGTRRSEVHT